MAQKFNIVAELQLRGPSNVKSVVSKLKRELGNVNINVNIKIDPKSLQIVAKLQKSLNSLSQSTVSASKSVNKLTSSASKNAKAVSQTAASLQQASSAAHAFGKQSALAVKRFAAFSVGAGMMYGLANAMKEGTKAAIDFERQFVKIAQVTGVSMKSLGSLQRQIDFLSTSLGVASSELVDVARVMSQTGLSARDVAKSLKVLAQSSLAPTFKDMKNTAEGAIAIMRQFGVTADGLAGKLGAINALAGKFAVESQDLIFAVRRAGGAFKAAGGQLEELLALFTSVRATTRESAETIATGFRTIFTRMQRPKTIEFLKSAGVELHNLAGNFVGPYEAVRRLSKALKTLETTDPRFQKIVEELGGFRQVSKVIPLIQQFGTAQKALKVAMRGQDSISKDAATAQQTLAVQIVKVREQFLALFRDIAGSDTFKGFAHVALNLAKSFINLGESLKPVLPLLAVFGTFKLASLGTQFLGGFAGGLKGGGGAKGMGQRMGGGGGGGQSATATATKQIQALTSNTQSITKLTGAVTKLSYTITKMSMASSVGGRAFQKGKPTYGPGFATGGIVPGTGFGDTVPAMLQPGEFVVRKSSVQKYGAGNLSRMNRGGAVRRYAFGGREPGPDVAGSLVKTPRRIERRDEVMRRRKLGREGRKKEKAGRGLEGGTEEHPILFGHAMGVSGFVTTGGQKGNFTPGKWQDNLLNITGSAAANDPGVKRYRGDEKGRKIGVVEKKSYPVFSPSTMNLKKDADVNQAIRDGGEGGMRKAVEDSIASVASLLEDFSVQKGSGAKAASKMVKDTDSFHTLLGYVTEGVIEGLSGAHVGGGQVGFDIPNIMGDGKDGLEALYGKKSIKAGVGEIKYSSSKLGGTIGVNKKSKSGLLHKIKNDILSGGHVMDAIGLAGPPFKPPGGKKKKRAAAGGTSGSSDTIPALLTPGEFVVNRKSAQRIGYSNLHSINQGKVRGYAKGGSVQKFANGGQPEAVPQSDAMDKYENNAKGAIKRLFKSFQNRVDEADDYSRVKRIGKQTGVDTTKARQAMKDADVAGGKGIAGKALRTVVTGLDRMIQVTAKFSKTIGASELATDAATSSIFGITEAFNKVDASADTAAKSQSQSDMSGKATVQQIAHGQKQGGVQQMPLGGFKPVGGGRAGSPGVLVPGGRQPANVASPQGVAAGATSSGKAQNKLQKGLSKLRSVFVKFMPTTSKLTSAIVSNTKTVATSTASAVKQKMAGRGAGGSMGGRSARKGEKRSGGEAAMMLMALPMAIDATVGSLGIQNKTFKELISVSQQLIMTMGTLSMMQSQFGGSLKGPMKMMKKGVFKKFGKSGLQNLKKFAKLGKAAAGVGIAFAAAGMVISHFGKKMQEEAITKAEGAKTEAESQQALADYKKGERVKSVGAGVGTGGAIGAVVGQIAIPIPIVGALIGGIVGGIVGGLAAYFGKMYTDNSKILQAMNRGRQSRILASMDKTLKKIQTEGIDSTSAGQLLIESQNLNRNISGAVGAEQAGELRTTGRQKVPEIRSAIDSIINASDGFDDFSTKFGGIGTDLIKELSVLTAVPFDELKKEFEEQAELVKKLNDAKKAEAAALKGQRDLTGELHSFRDALKQVTASVKDMGSSMSQIEAIASGGDVGAGATFGGAGVRGDIFTRAAAGEQVDQDKLSEAIKQTSPNEGIAKEAQSVADVSRELPGALLEATKAAGTSGEKLGPELKKALDARGIGGHIADVLSTKLTGLASSRQKSEGTIQGEVMDDPRKIAEELFGTASKQILAGLKEVADQIIETQKELNNMMNIRNSMEKKYSQMRINILKKQSAGRDAIRKAEDDSYTGISYKEAVSEDVKQQQIMLGGGGVRPGQDMSDMAITDMGDVEAMGKRLAAIDASIKAEQARIKILKAGSTEHAAATKKINDLGQKGQKLAGTLEHVAESGARLAAAQSEVAKLEQQRKAKSGMMTDIAFGNADELNTWDAKLTGASTLSAQANLGGGAAGAAHQQKQGMLPQQMIKQGKSGEKLAKEGLAHLRFLASNNLKFTEMMENEQGKMVAVERDPKEIIKEVTKQQFKATLREDPEKAAKLGITEDNIDALVDAQMDKSQTEIEAIDNMRNEYALAQKAMEALAKRQEKAVTDANALVEQAVVEGTAGIVESLNKLILAETETKKLEAKAKSDKAVTARDAAVSLTEGEGGEMFQDASGKFSAEKAKKFEAASASIAELRKTDQELRGAAGVSSWAGTSMGRESQGGIGVDYMREEMPIMRMGYAGQKEQRDIAAMGIMSEAVRYQEGAPGMETGGSGAAAVGRTILGRTTSDRERDEGAGNFEGGLFNKLQDAMQSGELGADDTTGQAAFISKFMAKELQKKGVGAEEVGGDEFNNMVAEMVKTIQNQKAGFTRQEGYSLGDQQQGMTGLMKNLQDYAINLQGRQTDAAARKGAAEEKLTGVVPEGMIEKFQDDPKLLQEYLDKIKATGGQDWDTLTGNVDKFGEALQTASQRVADATQVLKEAAFDKEIGKIGAAADVNLGLDPGTTAAKVKQVTADIEEKGVVQTAKDEGGKIADTAKNAATNFFNGLANLIPAHAEGGIFGAGGGAPAGSLSKGTDTRLAVLTPGEFVVNRKSTKDNLGLLQDINSRSNGGIIYRHEGGATPKVGGATPTLAGSDMGEGFFPYKSSGEMAEQLLKFDEDGDERVSPAEAGKMKPMNKAWYDLALKKSKKHETDMRGVFNSEKWDKPHWKKSDFWPERSDFTDTFEGRAQGFGRAAGKDGGALMVDRGKHGMVDMSDKAIAARAEKRKKYYENLYSGAVGEDSYVARYMKKWDVNKDGKVDKDEDSRREKEERKEEQALRRRIGVRAYKTLKNLRDRAQNLGLRQAFSEKYISDCGAKDATLGNCGTARENPGYAAEEKKIDALHRQIAQIESGEGPAEGETMDERVDRRGRNLEGAARKRKIKQSMNAKAGEHFQKAAGSLEWLGSNVKREGYSKGFKKLRKTLSALQAKTLQGISGMAEGGVIGGSMGNADTVPALLTPGEFVVNAVAASKNIGLLHSINSGPRHSPLRASRGGHIQRLQEGGLAATTAGATAQAISPEGTEAMLKLSTALDNFTNSQSIPNLASALDEFTRSFGQGIDLRLSGMGVEVKITGLSDLEGFAKTEVVQQIAEKLDQVANKVGVDGSTGRG